MYNLRSGNMLRTSSPTRLRPAFSLAELVVAVGVLALMFALVGQVFSLTLRSTGQARALTDTSQLLREFERTLRRDLEHVQPGSSLMVIQGNPVRAYWTQNGKDADPDRADAQTGRGPDNGYPHPKDVLREVAGDDSGRLEWPRADVLMLFTAHGEGGSGTFEKPSPNQAVVYGHAELGEYVRSGVNDWDFQPLSAEPMFPLTSSQREPAPPNESDVAPIPAERWHLARRSVVLVQGTSSKGVESLFDDEILLGATDVVAEFNYEKMVLKPMDDPLGQFPLCWPLVLFVPPGGQPPYVRSKLDLTPPAPLGDRLAHYCLPGCASFKVEWALDPHSEFVAGRLEGEREIYWFDPGAWDYASGNPTQADPAAQMRNAFDPDDGTTAFNPTRLENLLTEDTEHPDKAKYSLENRLGIGHPEWQIAPGGRPNYTMVFTATRRNQDTGELVSEDIFPAALRVTVDVYDSDDRLDRPIRHVMVLPVGSVGG